MEINLPQLLQDDPVLRVFLVIGFGYLVGNLRLLGASMGSTSGVLLAGLVFGHLGVPQIPILGTLGFALFIFSVGLQAGPSFFTVFLEDGRKYVALSVFVTLVAVAAAQSLARLIGLPFGVNAGLLAGALTSTPTLVGAQDAIASGLAALPEGMTAQHASSNVSVGYAITYLFGTVGLIAFIRYLPVLLRIDLVAEARRVADRRGLARRRRDSSGGDALPVIRAYRLSTEGTKGRTMDEVRARTGRDFRILRLRRGDRVLDYTPELRLEDGDIVSAMARITDHRAAQERLGSEVLDPELLNYQVVAREIVVTRPRATGRPLKDLDLIGTYGCFATGLIRASIELPIDPSLVVHKGDRLQITGELAGLQRLAEDIGYIEGEVERTDLLTFAFGIVAGLILGTLLIKLRHLSIGLGSAAGLLLVGILIGFLRSLHPTFGRVPAPARFILMELGLMLFMASVGLRAGGGIVEALTTLGPALILSGMLVTLLPVLLGYAFGYYVLKLDPVLLLGSLTGAMTSTPSLNVVTEAARSPIPALAYAGTYTFANVLLTFAGTAILVL